MNLIRDLLRYNIDIDNHLVALDVIWLRLMIIQIFIDDSPLKNWF